jgi:Cdc6-like AAA superfamily ATPase
MTIILNLYGSPGSGKSTSAASTFVKLKQAGRKVEYLTEYAKQLTYHERFNTLQEQVYVFAKQMHYLDGFLNSNSLEVVVTDSPLILSCLYAPSYYPSSFNQLVRDLYGRYHNINIWINRVKPYLQYGRTQTEDESDLLAINFKARLKNEFNLHLEEVDGDELAAEKILAILAREENTNV